MFIITALPISVKLHENILNGFQAIEQIWNYHCWIQGGGGITPKMYIQELQFLCSACHLMSFYFYEVSWQYLELFSTYKADTKLQLSNLKGRITPKILYRQELQFLCSARCLMMLYISVKFHEKILKSFQVIEQTQNYHCPISKVNNSKNV